MFYGMDTRCYLCDQIIQDVTELVTCSCGSSYHSVCLIEFGRSCVCGERLSIDEETVPCTGYEQRCHVTCTDDSSSLRETTTDVISNFKIRLYKFQNDLSSLENSDNVGIEDSVQSLPSTSKATPESIRQIGEIVRLPQTPTPSPARIYPTGLIKYISEKQENIHGYFQYKSYEGHKPSQMSTEGGGPKSMVKSHAENFARHLQSRLRSLSESEDGTWTSAGDPASLSSSSENETFFEIDSNITSPQEEITEPDFIAHTNYVDNLSTSPTNIHLCNQETELSKRDSVDEQFFDTVDLDDIDRSEESLPVACQCKPVSLPFPIPFSPSRNHHQYRNSQEEAQINGTLENTYLDAELSNSDCDGCSKLEENYNSPVVVNCNGFQSTKPRVENADFTNEIYNHLKLNYADEESESNECVIADEGIGRLQDVPTVTKTCIQNNECSNNLSINTQQQILENKTLNEFGKTMNEQIDNALDDEDKLSLKDLLDVIHKELKLEGKQINGPSSSSTRSGPEIKILEVPTVPEVVSSKTTARSLDEEEEDIETRRLRFRRCSSLKSGKTPPGTPGRKKIVRFADVLGLDLADVKTFMDEVPTIPKSAYEDLYGVESSTPPTVDPFGRISQPSERKERVVIPLFQQPGGHPNFIEKVRQFNVCLENAVVSDPSLLAITGTVRVKNIDFHKSVHIRYTLNSWKSFADLQAKYVPNSCDGFSDKFSFLMYANTLTVGQRLEFAVRFQARGTQFWDNNGGVNYVFECVNQNNPCLVTANMPSSPIDSWPSFY